MRALYDVNVLIALFDPQHTQHHKAKQWHAQTHTHGWASCPLTQNGLLRIVSQPRYPHPATVAELLALLVDATNDPSHEFWPDDISLAAGGTLHRTVPLTSSAITDIYLLALAVKHAGCLVTLDTRISRSTVVGATPDHLVVL